jgi:hypothetical protein
MAAALFDSAAPDLEAVLAKLGSQIERGLSSREGSDDAASHSRARSIDWPEIDALLPDGGLPRGVVELASPRALGGATSVALAAIRAAHARDPRAWCAWIDPEATLYAPGVAKAGVDLARLLVVRPPRAELGRIAVKVARSRAFEVIAIDMDAMPHARVTSEGSRTPRAPKRRAWPSEVLVRKLSLAAEEAGASILLLTNASASRAVPWPVSLRLELARPSREELTVRVAKDRRGRVGLARTVPFRSPSATAAR